MFTINEDGSIYVTRGDIAFFTVAAEKDGSPYKFQAGDVVRFKVMQKKACDKVAFQKDFPIEEETETVDIYLTTAETKIGKVISKPVDYWYEVELNPLTNPQTIIGYDDDGAKIFKLFPEGDDIEADDENKTSQEDIPVVDKELDTTSTRPVENQAVARAVVKINSQVKGLLTLPSEIDILRARLDNALNAATEDGEVIDIRVGFDGKTHSTAGQSVRNQIMKVMSAANLKDGIHIYPSKVSEYGITISGASLKPDTKYRLEYYDIYESGISISNVSYLIPNDTMDLEMPAEAIDGGYEFTTGTDACKEIYIDLSGDAWDGTFEVAEAIMDGMFLFNAEVMELSESLEELAEIFSTAVAKDGVPLLYYTHAENSITTISVLLKANTKYEVEYNSLFTPEINVDAVRVFDLVEASTSEINGVDNVFTFETSSNNCLILTLVVSGDGWDGSKETALQVIGGITVCRSSYNADEVMLADGTTAEEKITGLSKDVEKLKVNGSADIAEQIRKNTKAIEDLMYKAIAINSFSHTVMDTGNVGNTSVEIGSTVKSVMLAWEFNKEATAITVDDVAVSIEEVEKFGMLTQMYLNLDSDKTWTLKATDERGAVATKTTKLSFLNGAYYGVGAVPDVYDSDFILNLANKVLTSTKARTINVDAGADEYIFYCIPARLGACSFNVGGFDGGFELVATLDFTNASGYTESYYVYKSTNANLGSTTFKIS